MLPYDAEILFAFHAQLNRALWPLPLVAPLLAALALLLALRPRLLPGAGAAGGRIVAALLALGWAWVGWAYFLEGFALYNFAAPAYGALFLLQAALLLWSGTLRGSPGLGFAGDRSARDAFHWAGLLLALLALLACPLAGPLAGGGWAAAPLVGLMPGPTVLFTLGLLLLAESRGTLPLAVLPVLWAPVAGFEGWALGLPQDLVLAALCLLAGALLVWKRRARVPRP